MGFEREDVDQLEDDADNVEGYRGKEFFVYSFEPHLEDRERKSKSKSEKQYLGYYCRKPIRFLSD